MSWWDKYFAPGDIRAQRLQLQSPSPDGLPSIPKEVVVVVPDRAPSLPQADRLRRQNALLYGGLAFTALSIVVTRRAIQRKLAQHAPQTLNSAKQAGAEPQPPSTATASKADGSLEAIQALGYATLNVFSVFMLGAGAAMTYFDVADLEDMREGLRKAAGYESDQANKANEEIEGWIAETLARRDGQGNLRPGIAEKVAEVQRQAEGKGERPR